MESTRDLLPQGHRDDVSKSFSMTEHAEQLQIVVDLKQKTIAFNGYIPKINKNSSLTFYSKRILSENETQFKTICYH